MSRRRHTPFATGCRGFSRKSRVPATGNPAYAFVAFVLFVSFVLQKSNCALNFTKRGCRTLLGRSHVSVVGTKVWL